MYEKGRNWRYIGRNLRYMYAYPQIRIASTRAHGNEGSSVGLPKALVARAVT